MENKNGESNFVFRCHMKTENENGESNLKVEDQFPFSDFTGKQLAPRYTHLLPSGGKLYQLSVENIHVLWCNLVFLY